MCCCSVTKLWPTLRPSGLCSSPGSSVHGISQARILEWVAISFSRGSSWSRNWTHVSGSAGRFFTTEPPRKPHSFSRNDIHSKDRGRREMEGQKTETQEVLLKADQIKNRNLQISITPIKLEYGNHCRKVTSGLACPACEHLPLGISASGRNNWANIMSSCSSHSKLSTSTGLYAMFPLSSSCFKDAAVLNGEVKALMILKGNTGQFSSML